MRPGRAEDLPSLQELWRAQVRSVHRDAMPHADRFLATFDWAAKSRMIDSDGGRLAGAVLVLERATAGGSVTRIDIASDPNGDGRMDRELARWGVQLSQAAGARVAQVWLTKGQDDWLRDLGLELSRPWWRMDCSLAGPLPDPKAPAGYELRDASHVAAGTWADVHNRGFADHWRFSPRSEDELMAGRPLELSLMVVTSDGGEPAAVTLCQVETDAEDMRPQPVGIVGAVATVPEHRRRGLATWLVAEGMVRLRDAGARHASLYVDGQNHTRAYDLYTKLGFEVAFEAEVWEATFP